jgi:hypothetical protein
MNTMTTATTTTFTGYVLWRRQRRGCPWQMVATCASEREAWLRVTSAGVGDGDFTVLPAGTEP